MQLRAGASGSDLEAVDYRPRITTSFGSTPNPGALELSLSRVVIPLLAAVSLIEGAGALTRRRSTVLGLAELGVGAGLLQSRSKAPWLWTRTALSLVHGLQGVASLSPGRILLALAGAAASAYAAVELAPAARALGRLHRKSSVVRSVTIGRPPDELRRLWSRPEIQKEVWAPLAEVSRQDGRWRWRLKDPLPALSFETVQTEEPDGVRWRAADWIGDWARDWAADWTGDWTGEGAPVSGELRFRPAPGGRGTEAAMILDLPGLTERSAHGLIGAVPGAAAYSALRRFKALAEVGEAPKLQPLPSGRHH